ncbi:MAG TPA: hypothetical protein VK832_22550, partial [Burkholderiaceae bacterium]|nr:hypothetical protein [Burkholderiaceae bacterium]
MALFSTRLPTIQARISALVVACVLPAALASTLLLYHDYRMERSNVERSMVDTARALSQAIDRELIGAEATLRVLSTSSYLKDGDLQNFYWQTREVLQDAPSASFVLCNAHGEELINTLMPYGSKLTTHGNANHFSKVINARQPVISDIFTSDILKLPQVAVELEAIEGKQTSYVLSMDFLPAHFSEILEQQRLSRELVISLLDSSQTVIASTEQLGQLNTIKLSPEVLEKMNNRVEGTVELSEPKDASALFAFNRSGLSNWTLVIGVPSVSILGSLWETVSLLIVGNLLLLVLGLILAQVIGNQISRSIKGLVAPALALGHGNAVIVPGLQLREADDVGKALVKAAKLIQQRTVERDLATQAAQHIRE